jgi:ParB family chromosome partitioning protein
MSYAEKLAEMGQAVYDLADDQSRWSQHTFGSDVVRGPLGALRHLEKEAREAQEAPSDPMEYADCLLLLLDASRRAGISPLQLFRLGQQKMTVNRARVWPAPQGDLPVEHVKEQP